MSETVGTGAALCLRGRALRARAENEAGGRRPSPSTPNNPFPGSRGPREGPWTIPGCIP